MGKTIAQKVFETHLVDKPFEGTYVLKLDRVFCHEITTPIAINDLVSHNKDRVFDASKIKAVIDHVTPAKDSKTATQGKILREWANRNNIKDFFDNYNSLEEDEIITKAQTLYNEYIKSVNSVSFSTIYYCIATITLLFILIILVKKKES